MIRLILKTCLTVMAFLISASVSVAAQCANDPNECTPKKLCEIATTLEDANTIWSNLSSKAKHVTFAKNLGMTCGVLAIVDLCASDPSECKISQLCGKATTESSGKKSWDNSAEAYVTIAKEYGLQCDVAVEPATMRVITDFKQAFQSEPKLKRQQLQYALKELGYYSYGADGLWGKGTSSAFDKFVSGYGLKNNSEAAVFRSLLSKVTVPTLFAVATKKIAKAPLAKAGRDGLFPEYLCTTNKVDMNMAGLKITTNDGMTAATAVKPGGESMKLSPKEIREMVKEFNLDQAYSLRFSDNKVVLVDPNMNAQKISEALKNESPANKAKLTKIVEKFFVPKTYRINNNVASWSQRYPKEFELGNATLAHSFNLNTKQYFGSTKTTTPYRMQIKMWASCDPN